MRTIGTDPELSRPGKPMTGRGSPLTPTKIQPHRRPEHPELIVRTDRRPPSPKGTPCTPPKYPATPTEELSEHSRHEARSLTADVATAPTAPGDAAGINETAHPITPMAVFEGGRRDGP